ncbi:hypothetical protein LFM09_29555 [Lentzea alba]|uniref:hypothetical protein n=1 Tax=Lentzea alba TaxID=2714351 RepID=UPI0039BFF57A
MKKLSGGKGLAIVAVAGGAILASVAPVMADVAAQSPSQALVRVESPAKIKALGAAVEVNVTYSCPAGAAGYLYLNVSQTVFGGVATGSASKNVACTGGFEIVAVSVQATNRAFRLGTAFAKGDLNSYPHFGSHETEIKIGI